MGTRTSASGRRSCIRIELLDDRDGEPEGLAGSRLRLRERVAARRRVLDHHRLDRERRLDPACDQDTDHGVGHAEVAERGQFRGHIPIETTGRTPPRTLRGRATTGHADLGRSGVAAVGWCAVTDTTWGERWTTASSSGTTSPHRSGSTASARTTAAGSGTPDLVPVVLPISWRSCTPTTCAPTSPTRPTLANDRFVMSKGHAAPALYAALKAIGAIDDELLLSLRRMGSPIQGHPAPVPELPWIEVASGSLGQGLAVGLGMALAMRLDGAPGARVGAAGGLRDGRGLRLGSDGGRVLPRGRFAHRDPRPEPARSARPDDARAGRRTCSRSAPRPSAGRRSRSTATTSPRSTTPTPAATADDRPTLIVARTEKGHGVSFLANREGWHGKAVPADQEGPAIEELGGIRSIVVTPPMPDDYKAMIAGELHAAPAPTYPDGRSPRARRSARPSPGSRVIAPTSWSSTARWATPPTPRTSQAVAPERFIQLYIAEQCMIGVQTGLQALGKTAFAASFGAFLTRAADIVRMGAISRADLRICGSHAGVSIGEDGPSQMAVEDLAALPGTERIHRALPGRRQRHRQARDRDVRPRTASRTSAPRERRRRRSTDPTRSSRSGDRKTLRSSDDDVATLVGAGVTLSRVPGGRRPARGRRGPRPRASTAYCVKPIDAEALRAAIDATGLLGRRRGPPGGGRPGRRGARRARGDRPADRARDRSSAVTRDARVRHARTAPCLGGDRRGRDRRSRASGIASATAG